MHFLIANLDKEQFFRPIALGSSRTLTHKIIFREVYQ